jgi:hypothetical protein
MQKDATTIIMHFCLDKFEIRREYMFGQKVTLPVRMIGGKLSIVMHSYKSQRSLNYSGCYAMTRLSFLLLILALFGTTAMAQEWLDGGYVGRANYGEISQYFTDPIFFTKVPTTQPLGFYYPYIGYDGFYPFNVYQSEFRNRSLAAMHWEPIQKNWTETMSYAQGKSSLRVFEAGSWRSL